MFSLLFSLLAMAMVPAQAADNKDLTNALVAMPKCAVTCLISAVPKSRCSATDQACMCSDADLQQDVTICVTKSCTIKEAIMTRNLTATGCGEPIRDKSSEYITISNVFGIISGLFVIQRFAYKLWAKLEFGLDDWLTLVTIVTGVPDTVINAYGVGRRGIGRDAWTLNFSDIYRFAKYFYIMEVVYFFEIACLKLSLLFFYIRIFPAQPVKRLLWGTVIFTIVYGLTFILVALLQCRPIGYYWTRWDGEHQGTCLNINVIAWSNAAISIALDGWMLAIPLWQLKNLNLDWRRKIGVGLMFGVGTFVTVVSILRLRSLVKFGADSLNPTWDFYDVGIWSTIEINVGIICTCLPSLRLLLVHLFPKLLGTSRRYYARYASNQKSGNRRASRPVAAGGVGAINSIAQVEGGNYHHADKNISGIRCHRSYTVEYGDNDEVELVYATDLDMKSARSDGS